MFTEGTAVEARGRITPGCLGIWKDEQVGPLARVASIIKSYDAVPGIQLAHAGRKSSMNVPWERGRGLIADEAGGGWQTVAPSPIPFGPAYPEPHALDADEIPGILESFASGARRAREAGFQVIELHAAHGYLLHSFLSPIANHRDDAFGGSFEHRARLTLETVAAIRREWPAELPLFVRISATDWVEDRPAWTLADSIRLARLLGPLGVDVIDCSTGSIVPDIPIPEAPGYQVPFADAIRREAEIATAGVGLITQPEQAEAIIGDGQADLVVLARAMLDDPQWALHAARRLGAPIAWPAQYLRARHTGR